MSRTVCVLLISVPVLGALVLAARRLFTVSIATAAVHNSTEPALVSLLDTAGRHTNNQSALLSTDLPDTYNLVILAFTHEHQQCMNTWLGPLHDLEANHTNVRVHTLPSLPHLAWLARKQIDYWMSIAITAPYIRDTTVTLYTDVEVVQKVSTPGDTSTAQLYLVDQEGTVYWRGTGAYTVAKYDELTAVLRTLSEGAAP